MRVLSGVWKKISEKTYYCAHQSGVCGPAAAAVLAAVPASASPASCCTKAVMHGSRGEVWPRRIWGLGTSSKDQNLLPSCPTAPYTPHGKASGGTSAAATSRVLSGARPDTRSRKANSAVSQLVRAINEYDRNSQQRATNARPAHAQAAASIADKAAAATTTITAGRFPLSRSLLGRLQLVAVLTRATPKLPEATRAALLHHVLVGHLLLARP